MTGQIVDIMLAKCPMSEATCNAEMVQQHLHIVCKLNCNSVFDWQSELHNSKVPCSAPLACMIVQACHSDGQQMKVALQMLDMR